jgi:hypothetical protein
MDTASVFHEGGYSLEKLPAAAFLEIWYSNLLRYWKIHGSSAQYCALRLLLPAALVLRSAVYFASSFASGRSSESAQTLARLAWRMAVNSK